MRSAFTAFLASLGLCASAQNGWATLFRSDPELSDGYFILDQDKAAALGVDHVTVDIIAAELQPDGSSITTILETLTIGEVFYAQVDFELWGSLSDPFRVYYEAHGLDQLGLPVVDVQSLCDGCEAWPEVCRETCESNLYAYNLVAYSNGAQAFIEIQNGTVNGEACRLYVKASDWQAFTLMFDPMEHFGIGMGEWSEIISPPLYNEQTDVIRLDYPSETPPPGARDYMGYALGPVTQDVYAVKKGKGPWEGLYAHTENMAAQAVCLGGTDQLRPVYNADDLVENALAINNMDPLQCGGLMMSSTGLSWGSGSSTWCTEYTINEQTWGDPPNYLGSVTLSVVGCVHITFGFDPSGIPEPGGSGPNGDYAMSDIASISVHRWMATDREQVMTVAVNGVEDPRLWTAERTEVPAGLYEFRVVMNDGRMMKRFVKIDSPTTLSADFAAFSHISIYPVPVRDDRFAIDFDLGMPMDIALTVVNSMGTTYHTKNLSFPLAGLNKHIVETDGTWPEGIYHAVLQYADASTESVSFNIDY